MPKILDSALNHKKIIFFAVLFVAISSVFIIAFPHTTFAFNCVQFRNSGGNNTACIDGYPPDNVSINWNNGMFGVNNLAQEIIVEGARLILWGCYQLSAYSSYLLSFVLANVMNVTITKPDTTILGTPNAPLNFTIAWGQIRNLGNMLVVLGFVLVGVATALRLREYEAKKLLFPLIIVALCINFSGLFCGLIIDGSNIVTTGLGGGGSAMGELTMQKLQNASIGALVADDAINKPSIFVAKVILWSVIYLATAFTFAYLSLILIARFAILAMLYVLSPLAFAFWAFPSSKKLWSEWWNHFLKWCFVGVFGSFSLFLASPLLATLQAQTGLTTTIAIAIVFLGFIYVGFKMTSKSSGIAAMAAGAVIGLATGGAKLATGAVMTAGGATLKTAGKGIDAMSGGRISGGYQRASTWVGQKLEQAGLRNQGTSAQKFQGTMKETSGRISSMDEDQKSNIARGRAFTSQGIKDKVAAIQDKISSGKISDLGDPRASAADQLKQQKAAVAFAERYVKDRGGVSTIRKDAEKLNPNLALDTSVPVSHANNDKFRDAIEKQAPQEFSKNIDSSALTPQTLHVMDSKQANYLASKGAKKKRNAAKNTFTSAAGIAYRAGLTPAEQVEWDAKALLF